MEPNDDFEAEQLTLRSRRRLIFSNPHARVALLLTLVDLFVTFIFAVIPDSRDPESGQQKAIFIAQVTH